MRCNAAVSGTDASLLFRISLCLLCALFITSFSLTQTYSKAPEFVNMIALTIGEDTFNRGLDYYHTKFKYSNATTNDWIESMEKLSGQKLKDMADGE